MNKQRLEEKLTGRNKNGRKLGNNTYAERKGDDVAIRLHTTDILTYKSDGSVVVTSGGWKTVTTKSRLNEYLPFGYAITQTKGVWYWAKYRQNNSDITPFTDGDSISPDGKLVAQATPATSKANGKLRKRILAYSKLAGDSLPLPHPGSGDCWHCLFQNSMGDGFKDTSHLESHMDEGYIVPSLVYQAMKERGSSDLMIAATFGQPGTEGWLSGAAKDQVKRSVRKFMLKRFGLPS